MRPNPGLPRIAQENRQAALIYFVHRISSTEGLVQNRADDLLMVAHIDVMKATDASAHRDLTAGSFVRVASRVSFSTTKASYTTTSIACVLMGEESDM